jgi:ketosteroid isomerase-like protein
MSKFTGRAVLAIVLAAIVITVWRNHASAVAEWNSEIQMLQSRRDAAIKAKDIDGIMASYVNSDQLVVFDLVPPRQYKGWNSYKENWQGFLNGCKDSPTWETSDLHTMGGQGYAFSHSIAHLTCTDQKSAKMDMTLRVTDGYANFKGKWLIVHEHISVPVDPATGKADMESKP